MNAEFVTRLLTDSEFILWMAALVAAIHGKLHRKFPAAVYFLGLKFLVATAYSVLITYYPPGAKHASQAYSVFFIVYWIGYFLATVAVFFSIEQIIRRVLSPLPGLSKLGVVIFRFVGLLTTFIALTAHISEVSSLPFNVWIQALYVSFALCMCVFEVTLMALLIATAQRLGLNFRTRIFGLGLGFCLLGMVDCISLLSLVGGVSRWVGASATNEVVVFATLILWSAYFLLPEQKRGALNLKQSSTLMRWNEIVSQLGVGPQPVAEGAPSFMSDVEAVVTRIMERNGGAAR